MKDSFDVFHDYPIDPNGKSGNIDHIVVGPNRVFSIETTTVRKPTDDEKSKTALYSITVNTFSIHILKRKKVASNNQ